MRSKWLGGSHRNSSFGQMLIVLYSSRSQSDGVNYATQRMATQTRLYHIAEALKATRVSRSALKTLNAKKQQLENELQESEGPFMRALNSALQKLHVKREAKYGGALTGNNAKLVIDNRKVLLESLCRSDIFDRNGQPVARMWSSKWLNNQMATWNQVCPSFTVVRFCDSVRCTQSWTLSCGRRHCVDLKWCSWRRDV